MHARMMWKPSVNAIWLRAALRSAASGKRSGPNVDPPGAREGPAGLQADQRLARPERVRWAGHRLDREAAPVDVGKRVAGEQHQVRVGLVDPERQARRPSAVAERDASEPVAVALEIGEGVVELGRARSACGRRKSYSVPSTDSEPTGMPRSSDKRTVRAGRLRASTGSTGWRPALRYGWAPHPYGQARLPTFVAVVVTRRPSPESEVLDADREREGIAGLGVDQVLHHDPVRLALAPPSRRPSARGRGSRPALRGR